jgi:hypothetical protein
MKFPKPKTIKKKISWNISENTLAILAVYAKYTQTSEEEVVDEFIPNLLENQQFIEWAKAQRNHKKIDSILLGVADDSIIGETDGETDQTDSEN